MEESIVPASRKFSGLIRPVFNVIEYGWFVEVKKLTKYVYGSFDTGG